MRIRNRLLLSYLPLVAIILIFSLGSANWYINRALVSNKEEQLQSLASVQQHRLRYIVHHQIERFALIASRTRMRKLIQEYQANPGEEAANGILRILNDARASLDEFNGVGIATLEGNWIAVTDPYWFPEDLRDQPWLHDAMQKPGIYHFELDEEEIPGMYIAGPVLFDDALIGVLVIHATLESFTRATVDYTGLGETGETLLVMKDERGNAIFLTPTRFDPWAALKRTESSENLDSPVTQALLGRDDIISEANDYRDVPVVSAVRHIREHDWGLVVKQDRAEVLAPLGALRTYMIGLAALVLPVGALFVFLIARSVSTPVRDLTLRARALYELNSKEPLSEENLRGNEMHILSTVIHELTTALIDEKNQLEKRVRERTREMEQAVDELARSRERFAIAVEGSSDGLWDWPDVTEPAMWFSNRVYELLDLDPESFPATIDGFGGLIDESARPLVMHRLLDLGNHGGSLRDEFRMRTGKGEMRWVALRCVCRMDERTGRYRMAGSLQDIMAIKVAEASIHEMLLERQRQAMHDPLTELLNRRGFEERWDVEVARCRREDRPLSLLILDADHFKSVNDAWGHKIGDDVLTMLAGSIRDCLRPTDLAARFGGEEFVVVLAGTPLEEAEKVANRMREYIAEKQCSNGSGGVLSVTCSMGLTAYHPDRSLEETLQLADHALYRAKQEGRNRVVCAGVETVPDA